MKQTKQGNAARRTGKKTKKTEPFDFAVLFIVLTLVLFGVVMIFSSSYYYTMTNANFNNDMFYFLKRQAAWVVIGSAGMFMAMRIPYQFWKRLAFPAYLLSNFFLLLLPFFGTEAYGQKRWLGIGPLSFQPSEFTKIAVILYLSYYVLEHRSELANLKGFLKALGILLIPVGLIAVSNFSTALLLGLVGMVILFIASPRIWYFVVGAALLVPLGALAILIPQFRYRLDRILIWLDPWSDTLGDGYQIIQSLYAVASGGLFGLGLGQSRQKTFIPEPYNDFIFSIICEELGIIGAGLVVALLAVLVWRGIKIAMRARDNFGMLVAAGITSVIGFQSLINIGVVTNTIPNTGQPLPFISYGGTSLIFTMGMMGILMNISKFPKEGRNTE